jgi:GNAT superfamily N-acetyltransferase
MPETFYITEALPGDEIRDELIELSIVTQALTGIPDPNSFPPAELEDWLYNDRVDIRLLAIHSKTLEIIGHTAVEQPDPDHLEQWMAGAERLKLREPRTFLELGAAFVDPKFTLRGIGSALLVRGLNVVRRDVDAVPVAAAWKKSPHVEKRFSKHGGQRVATERAKGGRVSLYVFSRDHDQIATRRLS